MRKLKDLLLVSVVLLLVSCSMSAKSDKNETDDASSAKGEVVLINKADFLKNVYDYEKNPSEWVYEGSLPCIVDFYADWCGPCKKVAPILQELAAKYKDIIVIYKINVDNDKELASAFGIQSIPTLLFIPKKGKPQMARGALSKEEFVRQINEFMLGGKVIKAITRDCSIREKGLLLWPSEKNRIGNDR